MNYNLTLKSAPSIEPLTLAEVKNYLRLSDGSCNGIETNQSIKPSTYTPGTANGATVEVLGNSATVVLNTGTLTTGSTLDVTIQESNDGATWSTYQSFTQVTSANDDQTFVKEYAGSMRYVRAVGVTAVANANYSVDVILSEQDTSEDSYLTGLIIAARKWCEKYQNRAYITQNWEMSFDDFDEEVIEIPKGCLQDIVSIKYADADGDETTLTKNTNYVFSKRGILGRVTPAYGTCWPSFTPYPLDAVVIEFKCGYGDTEASVPETVRQAMYLLISHWYNNRALVSLGMSVSDEIKFTLSALLWQDRIVSV